MSEAERIAGALTPSMKRALLRVRNWPDEGTQVTPVAALNMHSFRALVRRQLVDHRIWACISCAILTPLGCDVRAILLKGPSHE